MYIKPLKSEIDVCLNCKRAKCSYGTCEYFNSKAKNYFIIRKSNDGSSEKRYFICLGSKNVKTAKYEFDSPLFTKREAIKMLKKIREHTKHIKSYVWTLEMNV